MQPFNTQFTLSRTYLSECFDQSLPHGKNAKPNFVFPALLLATGLGLWFFTEQPKVMSGMLLALAVLELVHIRFRRAWWLTRQMWGRSAHSEVELILDEKKILTKTNQSQTTLNWSDISNIIETDLGLILVTTSGTQQYLSKSLFPTELIDHILALGKK